MSNSVKDLEKERAQYSFKCIKEVWDNYLESKNNAKDINCKDENLEESKKSLCKEVEEKYKLADNYKSYVKKIPMMILNHGLAPTFAFVYSKKKDGNAWEVIYTQTTKWLKDEKKLIDSDELVEALINKKSQEYRMITNEVLALFEWLKRFAEGMIEDRKDGEG